MRARVLPAMVPTHFVFVDKLPLTANGKVDRLALPDPDFSQRQEIQTNIPPRNPTEEKLVVIWQRLLATEVVGVCDNFFALGGHSLLGVQLFAEVERTFGASPPLASLFEYPTVAGLAQLLDDGVSHYSQRSVTTMQPQGSGVPLFVFHNAAGEVAEYRPLVDRLGSQRPIYGIQAPWQRGEPLLFDSIGERVAHYVDEICAERPDGPLILLGYCHGGKLAYEAACLLEARGRDVPLVVLMDTRAHGPGQLQASSTLRERLLVDIPRAANYIHHWLREEYLQANRDQRRAYVHSFFQQIRRLRRNSPDRAKFSELVFDSAFQLGQYSQRLRRQYYRLTDNNLKTVRRFVAKSYSGSALVIRPEHPDHFSREFPDLGWSKYVRGSVEIAEASGHHAFMIRDKHVDHLIPPLVAAFDLVDQQAINQDLASVRVQRRAAQRECLEVTG